MRRIVLNRITRTVLLLLAGTALTWRVGEAPPAGWPRWAVLLLVFGLAFVKGRWVALRFMGLDQAPALWRRAVLGWLLAVVLGIAAFGLLLPPAG